MHYFQEQAGVQVFPGKQGSIIHNSDLGIENVIPSVSSILFPLALYAKHDAIWYRTSPVHLSHLLAGGVRSRKGRDFVQVLLSSNEEIIVDLYCH